MPGFEAGDGWNGVRAAAGTPNSVVTILHASIAEIMAEPQLLIAPFVDLDYEIFKPMSPEQFAPMLTAEAEKRAKAVTEIHVRPD